MGRGVRLVVPLLALIVIGACVNFAGANDDRPSSRPLQEQAAPHQRSAEASGNAPVTTSGAISRPTVHAPEETSSAQSQAAGAAARSQETEMAAMGAADPSVNQPISAAARLTVHDLARMTEAERQTAYGQALLNVQDDTLSSEVTTEAARVCTLIAAFEEAEVSRHGTGARADEPDASAALPAEEEQAEASGHGTGAHADEPDASAALPIEVELDQYLESLIADYVSHGHLGGWNHLPADLQRTARGAMVRLFTLLLQPEVPPGHAEGQTSSTSIHVPASAARSTSASRNDLDDLLAALSAQGQLPGWDRRSPDERGRTVRDVRGIVSGMAQREGPSLDLPPRAPAKDILTEPHHETGCSFFWTGAALTGLPYLCCGYERRKLRGLTIGGTWLAFGTFVIAIVFAAIKGWAMAWCPVVAFGALYALWRQVDVNRAKGDKNL